MRRILALAVLAALLPAGALAAPGDDPLIADVDGDGDLETIMVRETACFTAAGRVAPPCPDDAARDISVQLVDDCGGTRHRTTLDRRMEFVSVLETGDLDRDGRTLQVALETRAGATARGVRAQVFRFTASEDGCAVAHRLFRWPTRATRGRAPRGTVWQTGQLDLRGSDLVIRETFLRPRDAECCPAYVRFTRWRYSPRRRRFRVQRTTVRRVHRGA